MAFALTIPAFAGGDGLQPEYFRDGENVSPPLEWPAPPAGRLHGTHQGL